MRQDAPTADTSAASDRRNSFDLVRLMAALAVALAHQLNIIGDSLPGYGQFAICPSGPKLADAGLFVFFALSGYLVFRSLDSDPRLGRFALARGLRIYPGAIAAIVVCVVVGAAVTALPAAAYWTDPGTWRFLVHNGAILLTPTEFQLPGVLGEARWPAVDVPIWTLKYELLCYGVLFGLHRCAGRWRSAALGLLALGATAAFVYGRVVPPVGQTGLASLGGFEPVHVNRFFAVFFASAFYAAAGPFSGRARWAGAAGLAAVWLLAPFDAVRYVVAVLLLGFGAIELGRSRLLYSAAYHRLGDLSYGTYLYSFPIQMLTLSRWLTPGNVWLLTALDLALVLGCAALSWRLVERPAMRLKPPPLAPLGAMSAPSPHLVFSGRMRP